MDINNLKELLAVNGDAIEAKRMSNYMRNKFIFLGIPAPKRRLLAKHFLANSNRKKEVDWSFMMDCFEASEREFQYIALDYLNRQSKFLTINDIPNIKKLIETKSWWDSIDSLDKIVGDIAFKNKDVEKILLEWSINENFWLRRIAIDHQLSYKENTNKKLLATIISNNFNQDEFFINKAIGWALREYSKFNPDWVRNFINENKDNMAKLSVREASKYL